MKINSLLLCLVSMTVILLPAAQTQRALYKDEEEIANDLGLRAQHWVAFSNNRGRLIMLFGVANMDFYVACHSLICLSGDRQIEKAHSIIKKQEVLQELLEENKDTIFHDSDIFKLYQKEAPLRELYLRKVAVILGQEKLSASYCLHI